MKRFLSLLATGALALGLSTSVSAQVARPIGAGGLIIDDNHLDPTAVHTITLETPQFGTAAWTTWMNEGFPDVETLSPSPFPGLSSAFIYPGTGASVVPYLAYWLPAGVTSTYGSGNMGGATGAWDFATPGAMGLVTQSGLTNNEIPKWNTGVGGPDFIGSSLSDNGTLVSTSENFTAGTITGTAFDGGTGSFTTLGATTSETFTNLSTAGIVTNTSGGVLGTEVLSAVAVTSAAGTANEVLVDGTSGTAETGAVTVSLPTTLVAPGTFEATTSIQDAGLTTAGIVTNTATGTLGTVALVPVANGGTGSNLTATGGASEVLLQATVGGNVTVRQLANTDITGLGTMSTQNANAVAITGGTINGTTIGGTGAAAGSFTTLGATTSETFTNLSTAGIVTNTSGGVLGTEVLSAVAVTSAAGTANEVLVDGTSGTAETGAVTVSLPTTLVAPGTFEATTSVRDAGLTTAGIVTNTGTGVLGTVALVPVANGGTGSNLTATGGASEVLLQATVGGNVTVRQLANTDITGLGTMSTQNANSVAITGGSIAGTSVSGSTGSFTALAASTSETFTNLTTAGIVTNTAGGVLGTVAVVPVGNGGTGDASLTQHGVLLGNGANPLNVTAVGTTGQVLIGNTGADPSWTALSGIAVTSITGTTNEITATPSTGAVTLSFPNTLVAPGTFEATTSIQDAGLTTAGIVTNTATGTLGTVALVPVADGGTGSNLTATGGASEVLLQATVGGNVTVRQLANTDITGLGTMSTQNANSVAITGGSIAGTSVSGSTGSFTALAASTSETFTNLTTAGIVTNTAGGVLGTVAVVPVGNGGTGDASLTQHGVLLGNGANPLNVTAVGTTGQVLIGNTGADPSWTALSGIAVTSITGTTNEITATPSTGAVTLSFPNTLVAPGTFEATTSIQDAGLTTAGIVTNTATGTLGTVALVPVADGGTGSNLTATGGASEVLLQATVGGNVTVRQLANTDITGLGTMSTQNANAVAITGGTIDGTAIGGTTPEAGSFTALAASTSETFTNLTTAGIVTNTAGGVLGTVAVVPVGNGGTGDASLTQHGVLLGNGANPLNVTAVGTTGQVLIGNTGADPSWTALSGIAVTSITGTTNEITATPSTGAVTLSFPNTLVAPGTFEATTSIQDAGLTTAGIVTNTATGTLGTVALVPVADGGTGSNLTATGGASEVLLQATVGGNVTVRQLANTDITGLGTMSTQNANAVAITGGTIDGTVIGGTSPAAGSFTTLGATTSETFTNLSTAGIVTNTSGGVLGTVAVVPVGNGGTGDASLTQHGVLLGNGANPLNVTAVGTTGQVLIGNTGADPSWTALSGIAVTSITGTTNEITATPSTGAVTLSFPNTLVAPGTFEATTSIQDAGLTTAGIVTNTATGTLGTVALVPVADGGTGSNLTATGGASEVLLQATVGGNVTVRQLANTDITGLGTMSTQNANAVAITGGTIDGTAIGGTTPEAGSFTTLNASTSETFTNLTTAGIVTNTAGGVLGTVAVVPVGNGGTGDASLTQHGVLLGNGANPLNVTAVGTTGQVLIGNTGADPSWTALSGIAVTSITGTTNEITATPSTGAVTLSFPNTLVAPGTFEATTSIQDAGLTTAGIVTNTATGTLGTVALVPVADGGTGSNLTATGGASEVLLQATVGGNVTVRQLANTDITGLGTMSTQNANAVAITGGTIDGTAIGGTTPEAGSFTALAASTSETFTNLTTAGIVTNTAGGVLGTVAVVPVGNGGTGDASLTQHGVLLGNGANPLNVTAVGTTGQVLIGNTGADPSWTALSGIAVTSITGTTNEITATPSTGAVTLSFPNTLVAPGTFEATTSIQDAGLTTAGIVTNTATGTLGTVALVPVADGGTGSNLTATGGASEVLLQATVGGNVTVRQLANTDITGLGTMSTQNANAVAITGGTIDGTAIGGTTPEAGSFTTLNASTSETFTNLTTSGIVTNTAGGVLGTETLSSVAVTSATGTANEVLVNGVSGTAETGAVTVSLPTTLVAPGTFEATTSMQDDGLTTAGIVTNDVNGNLGTTAVVPIANGGTNLSATGAAGTVLLTTDGSTLTYAQIADANVSATAAIAGTKISPNFGSQAVTTSGNISTTSTGTITSAGTLTASGNLVGGGGVQLHTIVTTGAPYQALASDYYIIVQTGGTGVTAPVGAVAGQKLVITNATSSGLTGDFIVPPTTTWNLIFDGTNWQLMN